jgi:high-affinity Fe2+/Pb2+ permease
MTEPSARRQTRTIGERRRMLRIGALAVPIVGLLGVFIVWRGNDAGVNRWVAGLTGVLAIILGILLWYISCHLAETSRDREA